MLTKRPHPRTPDTVGKRAVLSDELGYTLIEMLVAMVTGLVITFALFAILQFSMNQTTRLTDFAHSTQLGRTTLTKIVDELHSACLAPGFTPIQAESSSTELRFINAYSEKAIISEKEQEAYKHKIVWNEKANTLTDFVYKSNGGTWPNFTFSEAATPAAGVLIGSNIRQSESGGKKLPIFRYYSYNAESSESATTGLTTLNAEPLASPLTTITAPTAASVLISFNTAPSATATTAVTQGRTADLSSQVTLAFAAPISESEGGVDAPCQ